MIGTVIKIILKYQYILIIILSLIITIQNYNLIYTQIEKLNKKSKEKLNKKSNKKRGEVNIHDNDNMHIVLFISEKKDKYGINGYYEIYTKKLYNDAFVFKNTKLQIWIYKVYDIIDNEKIFYWIITPIDPNDYNNLKDVDKKIYFSSILLLNLYNNGLSQYIDYGIIPNGRFYDTQNNQDFIDVTTLK